VEKRQKCGIYKANDISIFFQFEGVRKLEVSDFESAGFALVEGKCERKKMD
jgi:hypothetical protein